MKHVLLIDDNEVDLFITKEILRRFCNPEIITTKNSAKGALEFLESCINSNDDFPDVMFVDIQMPDINGFGFLDRIEKYPDEKFQNCTIYMLTSSNDQRDIDRSYQYKKVEKFITKPLSVKILNEITVR